MVFLMTIIGNSGFEYITKNDSRKRQKGLLCSIRDIKTKEVIKTIRGTGKFNPRGGQAFGGNIPTCKFLGHNKKYYYLQISNGTTIDWGQVQSDGVVLRPDRTVLTVLAFFPNYEKPKTNVPVKTPIIITRPPNIPKIITVPKTTLSTKMSIGVIPDMPPIEDKISWIQKIIKKIIDWMKKILNP